MGFVFRIKINILRVFTAIVPRGLALLHPRTPRGVRMWVVQDSPAFLSLGPSNPFFSYRWMHGDREMEGETVVVG